MTRIYLTRSLPPIARELLAKHFTVDGNDENKPLPYAVLSSIVPLYDGVLATVADRFDEAFFRKPSRLKAISNYAAGLDNIDLAAAKKNRVVLYNTPDVVTEPTADMTFALLLALERQVFRAFDFVKSGQWKSWDPKLFVGHGLKGKVMGICGFGRIGKSVGRRALGFGMRVVYYDPFIENEDHRLSAEAAAVELNELLKICDYLSVHVPMNDSTRRMFNLQLFSKLERSPLFINMARGPVVDTEALIQALEKKWIRGAALDVTDPEPLPGSNPLCGMDNVLITPHIGTATEECRRDMAKEAAEHLIRHFLG